MASTVTMPELDPSDQQLQISSMSESIQEPALANQTVGTDAVVPEVSNDSLTSLNVQSLKADSVKQDEDSHNSTAVAAVVTSSPSLSPSTSLDVVMSLDSPSNTTISPAASLSSSPSFDSNLNLEPAIASQITPESSTIQASKPVVTAISTLQQSALPSSPTSEAPASPSTEGNVTPSTTTKFGPKKSRVNPGSNISRRINMLAEGKNENNSDLHTISHARASSANGRLSPDLEEYKDYPDSFFEEILREDQTTIARSFSTMPKSSPRPTHTLVTKNSSPARLSSSMKSPSASGDSVASEPAFVRSDDLEEDLKRLQTELIRAKETKTKAEADAKDQRVTIMSLKTEIQMVRNVLKRRETELGDVKDMSNAYESELAELRQKLEKSERQLSRGQGEMEAKLRALERTRDESIARIQTLDKEIKKLREQLQEAEKKNEEAQAEILDLREELEELAPFRNAANEQRELSASEPAKVKELSLQITDLEDTRDMQAALIEELETKISTVEANALEFKSKAAQEYEALSDGFKLLKNRRSEEIKELKAELEQHKLQEQIIVKLQADIDQLQAALASVADSQSTENARINQVTAELNEALALKDQEVIQVRQNMTEFEDSHNRLVSSLQATLATINEEADAARKSRDEAVAALESLREELEALRHSLPINKHQSLSQWSAEQQQLQQEQLQAIRELEEKLDGQVEGVKEEQQRAGILEANTKRRSQQLSLDMAHHLHLSSAMVKKSSLADLRGEKSSKHAEKSSETPTDTTSKRASTIMESGTVSVRTMLKFLSQLQGRSTHEPFKGSHVRESTDATVIGENDINYESELRAYLVGLNDATLMEPWAKEKELEGEITQLEKRIQSLLQDLSAANKKNSEAQSVLKAAKEEYDAQLQEEREQRDELERLEREEREDFERKRDEEIQRQVQSLELKEKELLLKEQSLREKEIELKDHQGRAGSLPVSPPITPFGSPGNSDLLPGMMAAHQDELERQHQAEMAAQQIKLIKSLEEKIAELEKRGSLPNTPGLDEQYQASHAFPSPTLTATPRSSAALSRIGSQTMRSNLLSNPPDTPPPTIALPPIPTSTESNDHVSPGPRSSSPASEDGALTSRKKSTMAHSVSSESLVNKTATEAAVAAAVLKAQENQKELATKLETSEAELKKSQSKNRELEKELATVVQNYKQGGQSIESEMQKLKQENNELAQVLEEIRKSLDQAQNQVRGLEALKSQLEAQVQTERQAKDAAIRQQDHLQEQLETERQKKKGFLCF
ncbi:hypothetical protein BX616_003342 [Lobosporangium transversale]|uniref:Uncharacterized protein n=1 Tax=Lobosporangium transversale TaxID=64571 RepID=A0A1Y2GZV1_9FUNG|nr:hypothetical protein BCR41DRAFT_384447 [Lobosporangium transversale]KAF9899038.1 hypothetical protein BX616_003342 [Lobosporangium transversale]ORZ26342.1 hypothetical protein BCR41DRAFT_384447 [Lobosporangium transversale]|eukprot:XP_021884107.1 hypothetical protein BCR41DRAFT_384447 [Lobosporangium transversale]